MRLCVSVCVCEREREHERERERERMLAVRRMAGVCGVCVCV